MRTDGTSLRQLTNDPFRDNGPSWFPDSDRLMFRSDRGGRFQVWTIALDGGSLTQVTDYPATISVLWLAPDGRRAVAAVANTSTAIMFDPRVGAQQQKPEQLPSFANDLFLPTSWSSDGTRIAGLFQRGRQIMVYSVTSRDYEQFAERTNGMEWLPDNRSLLHTTGRELRVLDTTAKVSKLLLSLPTEFIGSRALSPNGREIYIPITKPQGDIVIANIARGPT